MRDHTWELERSRRGMMNENAIFVFGSNLRGIHGAGAARYALDHYGALLGKREGHINACYAIPTKDRTLQPLTLAQIAEGVARFIKYADFHPELNFIVTRIGCGYAGYTDTDIYPMFANAPANCLLPEGWR